MRIRYKNKKKIINFTNKKNKKKYNRFGIVIYEHKLFLLFNWLLKKIFLQFNSVIFNCINVFCLLSNYSFKGIINIFNHEQIYSYINNLYSLLPTIFLYNSKYK